MSSFKKIALKGAGSVISLRIFTLVLVFIRLLVLARILIPAQFGVFGVATLLLTVTEIFTETGVGIFLLQQEKSKFLEYLNSAWMISIIRGILVTLIMVTAAPFIQNFFSLENAFGLFILASFIPLIKGFTNPALYLLQKNLEFRRESVLKGVSVVIGSVAMIIAALWLRSPLALVLGLLIETVVEVVLSFIALKERPILLYEKKKVATILQQGKWVTAVSITNYIFHNFDDIVVGRFFGAATLGMYQMAYRIGMLPINEGANVLSKVTLPIFTQFAADTKRLQKAFWQITTLTIAGSCIAVLVIFMFGESLLQLMLGEKWNGITPFVQTLIIFGSIRAISGFNATILYVRHKQKQVSIITATSMVGLLISIFPLIHHYGVIGAAYASIFGAVCAAPVMYYYLYQEFKT